MSDDLADAFARYLSNETGTPAQQRESGSSDVLSEAAQQTDVPVLGDDESSGNSARVPVVPVVDEHDDANTQFERADSESTTFNSTNGVNHGRTRYDA